MTISAHISCAVISGTQPNLFFAFDGSPNNVSTSAGLKYLGSIFIITSPTFNAGARSPSIFSIVAISSIPLPVKEISKPSSRALHLMNSRTEYCLPVAITKSSGYLPEASSTAF